MTYVADEVRRDGHLPIVGTVGLALSLLVATSRQIVGLVAFQIILALAPGWLLDRFGGAVAGVAASAIVDFVFGQAAFAISNGAIYAIAFAASMQRRCSIGAALRKSASRFRAMLLIGLSQALPGQIEDFIPKTSGLFATATLVVYLLTVTAQPVCMIEGVGPLASLGRAIALTRRNRWRIVGLIIAIALVVLAFLITVGLLAVPIVGYGSLLSSKDMPWLPRFGGVLLGLSVVTAPLSLIALVPMALYINLRAIEIGGVPRRPIDDIATI